MIIATFLESMKILSMKLCLGFIIPIKKMKSSSCLRGDKNKWKKKSKGIQSHMYQADTLWYLYQCPSSFTHLFITSSFL